MANAQVPVLRRSLLLTAFVVSLAIGGFTAFSMHRSSTAEEIPAVHRADSTKGDNPMPAVARTRPIPPIDAAAPPKTETATFAMG